MSVQYPFHQLRRHCRVSGILRSVPVSPPLLPHQKVTTSSSDRQNEDWRTTGFLRTLLFPEPLSMVTEDRPRPWGSESRIGDMLASSRSILSLRSCQRSYRLHV